MPFWTVNLILVPKLMEGEVKESRALIGHGWVPCSPMEPMRSHPPQPQGLNTEEGWSPKAQREGLLEKEGAVQGKTKPSAPVFFEAAAVPSHPQPLASLRKVLSSLHDSSLAIPPPRETQTTPASFPGACSISWLLYRVTWVQTQQFGPSTHLHAP